ncbi:MAG: hypothetical protein VX278_03950 [Myxococcota bacterium]|nr:hypothetical protein [Myxococcota bacterium]
MGWDRSWGFTHKKLTVKTIEEKASAIAQSYVGVSVSVEKEAEDCISCFFSVPISQEEDTAYQTIEISIYTMSKNQYAISLEADASDNRLSEDADQLAEDMATALEATSLDE